MKMKHFKYVGDITEGLDDSNLHALDYYIVTNDVVCAAKQMYDEEVSDGSFLIMMTLLILFLNVKLMWKM